MLVFMLLVVLIAGTVRPSQAESSSLPVPVAIPDGLPDNVRRDLSTQNARLIGTMYELRSQQERYAGLCGPPVGFGDPMPTHDCDNFRDQLANDINRYSDRVEAFNLSITTIVESAEYLALQHLNRGIQIFRSYFQGNWGGDSSPTGPREGLDAAF